MCASVFGGVSFFKKRDYCQERYTIEVVLRRFDSLKPCDFKPSPSGNEKNFLSNFLDASWGREPGTRGLCFGGDTKPHEGVWGWVEGWGHCGGGRVGSSPAALAGHCLALGAPRGHGERPLKSGSAGANSPAEGTNAAFLGAFSADGRGKVPRPFPALLLRASEGAGGARRSAAPDPALRGGGAQSLEQDPPPAAVRGLQE